ncbi:MAG: thioredoxin [Ruminococcus sp.]|nr:thioredoxin [Ruminococcus sp.]
MINEINNNNFDAVIAAGTAVVDFNATWCGPCRMLEPVLEELSGEMKGVSFFSCDVDENGELAAEFGIMSIPAVGVFKNGKLVNMSVGFKPKPQLAAFIGAAIK